MKNKRRHKMILRQRMPFRDTECNRYDECLTKAAKKNAMLSCEDCHEKQENPKQ
jgi:hypothetical protein